jgi:GTPase Era involved in 16S rRNA processing
MAEFKIFDEIESIKDELLFLLQDEEKRSQVEKLWEEKIKKNSPLTLLFYGIYNAGKSTLINALAGEEVAEVGSIPTTKKIHVYPPWKDIVSFVDSPGLDAAGRELDELSRDYTIKVDVVLFVISSSHIEGKMVWEELQRLLQFQKPLILVVNEKGIIKESDEKRIVELVLTGLKEFSEEFNEKQNLIGPVLVKARRGFNGKVSKDDVLIQESQILYLEKIIIDTVKEVEGIARLKSVLLFLKENILKKELEYIHNKIDQFKKPYPKALKILSIIQKEIMGYAETKLSEKKVELTEFLETGLQTITKSYSLNNIEQAGLDFINEQLMKGIQQSLNIIYQSCVEECKKRIMNLEDEFKIPEELVRSDAKERSNVYIKGVLEKGINDEDSSGGISDKEIPAGERYYTHSDKEIQGPDLGINKPISPLSPIKDGLKTLISQGDKETSKFIRDILAGLRKRPPRMSPQKFGAELTKQSKMFAKALKVLGWVITIGIETYDIIKSIKDIEKEEKKENRFRSRVYNLLLAQGKLVLNNSIDLCRTIIAEEIREIVKEVSKKLLEREEKQNQELQQWIQRQSKIDTLTNRVESLFNSLH